MTMSGNADALEDEYHLTCLTRSSTGEIRLGHQHVSINVNKDKILSSFSPRLGICGHRIVCRHVATHLEILS